MPWLSAAVKPSSVSTANNQSSSKSERWRALNTGSSAPIWVALPCFCPRFNREHLTPRGTGHGASRYTSSPNSPLGTAPNTIRPHQALDYRTPLQFPPAPRHPPPERTPLRLTCPERVQALDSAAVHPVSSSAGSWPGRRGVLV